MEKTYLSYRYIDLTHPITPMIPTWSGSVCFQEKKEWHSDTNEPSDFGFCLYEYTFTAGIGTHVDAPCHCFKGMKSIDAIDLTEMIAPMFVIDITSKAHETYLVSPEDIFEYETQYGKIVSKSHVFIRTGWSRFWNDRDRYRNGCQFPSIGKDAGEVLLQRGIQALGIDTLSPDTISSGFPIHRLMLQHNVLIVENVANLEQVPPYGALSGLFPMPFVGGSESPCRLIAMVPL